MDSFQVIINQWVESMEKGLDSAKNEEVQKIGKKIVEGFKSYIADKTIIEIVEKDRKDRISQVVNTLSEIALVETCIALGVLKAAESYSVKTLRKNLTNFIYTNLFAL